MKEKRMLFYISTIGLYLFTVFGQWVCGLAFDNQSYSQQREMRLRMLAVIALCVLCVRLLRGGNKHKYIFRVVFGIALSVCFVADMTDGYGATEFAKTLLYYYLLEVGKPVTDEGKIRLNETPFDAESEDELAYLKYYDPVLAPPQKKAGSTALFSLPMKYWDEEGQYIYRRFKITLSAEEILKSANSSSATAVVNALICKSFAKAYNLQEKASDFQHNIHFSVFAPQRNLAKLFGMFHVLLFAEYAFLVFAMI